LEFIPSAQDLDVIEPYGSIFEDTLTQLRNPSNSESKSGYDYPGSFLGTGSPVGSGTRPGGPPQRGKTSLPASPLDVQLLLFASTNNIVVVRWLLLMGANPLCCDSNGTTALHAAARSGSVMIIRDLIARSNHDLLNKSDNFGCTPLHIASSLARRGVIQDLLQAQADVNIYNNKFQTPLDLALDRKSKQLLLRFATTNPTSGGNPNSRQPPVPLLVPAPSSTDRVLLDDRERRNSNATDHGDEDDNTAKIVKFEPFFVPRKPVVTDKQYKVDLSRLGVHFFNSSSPSSQGRALAFLVASNCCQDFPIALSIFLKRRHCDTDKIGSFLGGSFSLSHVLRVEFLNSIRLSNTGVISSMRKLFTNLQIPPELRKVDRILFDTALTWWRQVSKRQKKRKQELSEGKTSEPPAVNSASPDGESTGEHLMSQLRSFEALHQLMLSVLFLHWNHHSLSSMNTEGVGNPFKAISFEEFVALNQGIENISSDMDVVGSNVPEALLKELYTHITQIQFPELENAVCASKNLEQMSDVLSTVWGQDKLILSPETALSSKLDYKSILGLDSVHEDALQSDFGCWLNCQFCDPQLTPISIESMVKIITGNSTRSNHVFLGDESLVGSFFGYKEQMKDNAEKSGASGQGNSNPKASAPLTSSVAGGEIPNNVKPNNPSHHYASLNSLMGESIEGGSSLIKPQNGTGDLLAGTSIYMSQSDDGGEGRASRGFDSIIDEAGNEIATGKKVPIASHKDLLLSGVAGLQYQQTGNHGPSTSQKAYNAMSTGVGIASSAVIAASKKDAETAPFPCPEWASISIVDKTSLPRVVRKKEEAEKNLQESTMESSGGYDISMSSSLDEHSAFNDSLTTNNCYLVLVCGLILFHSSESEPPFAFINLRDSGNRSMICTPLSEDEQYSSIRKQQLKRETEKLQMEAKVRGTAFNSPPPVYELVLYKKPVFPSSSTVGSSSAASRDRIEVTLLFPDARWDFFHAPSIRLRFPSQHQLNRWRCRINLVLEQGLSGNF